MRAVLEYEISKGCFSVKYPEDGSGYKNWREVEAGDGERFEEWITVYRIAAADRSGEREQTRAALLNIGHEIYKWLNGDEGWMEQILDLHSAPPLQVEFRVSSRPGQKEGRFLEVPWELAANPSSQPQQHLAADPYVLYNPVRRIGAAKTPQEPSKYRLHTVFMAAAPDRTSGVQGHLRFEEEESALIDAAGKTGIDLTVEESGNLQLLAQTMADEKKVHPVDLLHISCHGGFVAAEGENAVPYPVLYLETEEGAPHPVTAGELAGALGDAKPRLLFLSACSSSETTSDADGFLSSYTVEQVRRGVPAVLGWSGSVSDREATRFAGCLYRYMAGGGGVEDSLARARYDLLRPPGKKEGEPGGRDWHLARLLLGPTGGGRLSGGCSKRRNVDRDYGHKDFLKAKGHDIPVAGRREFVGRRRQIQAITREFREPSPSYAGVLIHGFGRQGKSSLAARIAHRHPDLRVVPVFGRYDAQALLESLLFSAGTPEMTTQINAHRDEALRDPDQFFSLMKGLLEGPYGPVLLVLDDFERVLEEPSGEGLHRVKSKLVEPLARLVAAFDSAGGMTGWRLLVTSRYRFVLKWRGRDWAERLMPLHLPPMADYEGRKMAAAKEKALGVKPGTLDDRRTGRCIAASRGNPGLQDLLFKMGINAPQECDRALAEVEEYVRDGSAPGEAALQEFIGNLAVDRLLALLTPGQQELLRASTLFSLPVPLETLQLLARELGVSAGKETRGRKGGGAGERLLGFGLWEPFPDVVDPATDAAALHGLVRGKAGVLSETEKAALSGLVVEDLYHRWGGADRAKRSFAADIQLAGLALSAGHTGVLSETANDAVRGLEEQFLYLPAAELGRSAIAALDSAGVEVPPQLLRAAAEVSQTVGDMENARKYIERCVAALSPGADNDNNEDYAYALQAHGRMLVDSGEPDRALALFREAETHLQSENNLRERSILLGDIARILRNKGAVDDALKLHREKLEIVESLGDRRERAVTLGDIARILTDKGAVDDALKLHRERQQVYESLGDRRSRAVTLGDIARILRNKGAVDDALKLHREQVELFESLGDCRSRAVTLGDIANIQAARGNMDEALKLHQEEINIYDELGDIGSKAATLFEIAQIELQQESIESAYQNLSESYAILLKTGRLDGICMVGLYLGQILCRDGQTEDGLDILQRSHDGFKQLGQEQFAQQTLQMIEDVKNK